MPKKIDVNDEMWEKLKLEYISSDISFRGLEKKYGVPFSQIQKRASHGKWTDLKGEAKSQVLQKSIDMITDHKAEECSRAFRVASKILDKIETIVEQIDETSPDALRDIKSATSSIKDLKEIGLFRAELDKQEQVARIKKLQKDAEEEQKDTTITVTFENMDDYAG